MVCLRGQRMRSMRSCTRQPTVLHGRRGLGKLLAEGINVHERTLTAEAKHVRHEQRHKASAELVSSGL